MSDPLNIREMFSSIQGEGMLAGRRQVFIRLTECNLDCSYCDTQHQKSDTCSMETEPGSNRFHPIKQPLSLSTVLDTCADWTRQLPHAHHSISLTGGEPLLSSDVLKGWLPELRRVLPIHLETNGTMHVALEEVIQHLEYISMDMKLPSTSACTDNLWDLHRLFLKSARAVNVSVKLVIGDDSTREELLQACDIIATVDPEIPLFLQPVTLPGGKVGISAVHLLQFQGIAAARLPDVRVIPQMHKLLGVA